MALSPTIFKFKIDLSNTDRNHYDTLNLTVAQHPSETVERMMARVLAFCINAEYNPVFTKGLSEVNEPAIWSHTLDGLLSLWIDVGEPSAERIKKATRLASKTIIYSFNSKSETWWGQEQNRCSRLKVSVYQFQWEAIQALAKLVQRTMNLAVIITDDSAYIANELGECEVAWATLQES